jgi:cytochrome c-type biogenesis protein CcmH
MSGWVALAALFVASLGGLWLLGLRGAMLQLAAAALFVGSAGYALQGRPGLAGSPQAATEGKQVISTTAARHAFFGDFSPGEHWFIIADSFANRGKTMEAVGVLRSAVRAHPEDAQLWIALGNALVDHSGVLTPASQLAYQRAAKLAPEHPAPSFFFGLALARSEDHEDAIRIWSQILANAPANARWRPLVEDAIAALREGTRPR